MGQEIATTRFRAEDFERYKGRCKRELALLRTLLAQGRLSERGSVAGVELEAWLVDDAGQPRPINDAFLERTWRACLDAAAGLDATLVAIGILPTVRDSMLSPANMSTSKRY